MRFFNKPPTNHDILYYCRKALLQGEKLNTYDFYYATGCQRLAARIDYLSNHKYGTKWPIQRSWISRPNPQTSRITNIMSYWLEPSEIARIKKAQTEAQAK